MAQRGFMLNSGCEVSPEVFGYHVYMVQKAVQDFGDYDNWNECFTFRRNIQACMLSCKDKLSWRLLRLTPDPAVLKLK